MSISVFTGLFKRPIFKNAFYIVILSLITLPFTGIALSVKICVALLVFTILLGKLKGFVSKINLTVPLYFKTLTDSPKRPILYIVLFIMVLIPLMPSSQYVTDVLTLCLIYGILASGLNVIVGMTGLLHLGYAAFYAIGAYTHAMLTIHVGLNFWLSASFSALFSAFIGLVLAFPAFRLRGDYLAIVTLGFGEILRVILNNWREVTNGPNGISGIPAPSMFVLTFANVNLYFYLTLFFTILTLTTIQRIEHSRIGRAWHAIREDEAAAQALGINVTVYKLLSFAFGSFWAGLAGAIFASKMGFISPESFTFLESAMILCMVILGGLGNTYGALAGAFLLIAIPELLRELQTYRMLFVGFGLVILMHFMPQGIAGRLSLHAKNK
jgi:branched-chain amino acid transport system permease protein